MGVDAGSDNFSNRVRNNDLLLHVTRMQAMLGA